ncbi:MAG: cysteine desulfurase [Planctomycetota bacterium]|nr:MAG: cysteine desulfurase [Planctomycetota bacterium]
MAKVVYLDNHATTRCDPRVVEAMLPYLSELYANPASTTHEPGRRVRSAVENARSRVAACLGVADDEVVFTSGATEANNLAIWGTWRRQREKRPHVVTSAIEHPSVLEAVRRVEREGGRITILPPDDRTSELPGRIHPEQVAEALTPETGLVSIMAANNEIGTLQPIAQIGAVCREKGVLFHVDAVQAMSTQTVSVGAWNADLVSVSSHKIYGPKGVGALVVRRRRPRIRLEPLIVGGGHERGLRSGTLNVPAIIGFAAACDLLAAERESDVARVRRLRDRLYDGLKARVSDIHLNGPALDSPDRLPNNLNVMFSRVEGETLLLHCPSIAASSGAACSSSKPEPSHVLTAIGLTEDEARCSVRFGLGRFNSDDDVTSAVEAVAEAVARLRQSVS